MYPDIEREYEYREWRIRSIRRSRNYLFILAVFALFGVAAFAYSSLFNVASPIINSIFLADVLLLVILCIYWYLQIKPVNFPNDIFLKNNESHFLKSELSKINEIEEAISIYDGTETQATNLAKFISRRIDVFPYYQRIEFRNEESLHEDFDKIILIDKTKLHLFQISLKILKNTIKDNLEEEDKKVSTLGQEESEKEKSIERMNKLINTTTIRIKNEIEQLSKKANIYIAFGSAITMAAGLVLYIAVQDVLKIYTVDINGATDPITSKDIFSMIIRFSIVVFIEIFAFYYLKLYRNIIDDIRFYQNEITNIEMKILSLYVAENGKCIDSIKNLSVELSKTERNFTIDKSKTTVDIENRKQESEGMRSTTDNIVKIIKSIRP